MSEEAKLLKEIHTTLRFILFVLSMIAGFLVASAFSGCVKEKPLKAQVESSQAESSSEPMDSNSTISIITSYMCYSNKDGSMGAFMGGDYEMYQEKYEYERNHPESYLTGANLLFYTKLKAIEDKLQELDAKIKQFGKTFDFYIDPNDTNTATWHLPEGTRVVTIRDLQDYRKRRRAK